MERTIPLLDVQDVVLSDSAPLAAGVCRAIWVGADGDVKITTAQGTAVVLPGIKAGSLLPIYAQRIWATGTTVAAGNIKACY